MTGASIGSALVVASVWLALPERPRGAAPARPGPGGVSVRLVLVLLVALGLAGVSWLQPRQLVLIVVAGLTALGIVRILRRRRAAAAADRRAEQVLAACDALASDLLAGQPPSRALERAAAEWSELAPVAAAGTMGTDVPQALRAVAARPGAGHLRRVAATWQVAHDTGAGLAGSMQVAARAIREDMRTTRLVATELAAAHATARLLAVLPFFVLLLGLGVGADPMGFLLGSTPGVVVLGSGLGLSFGGLFWLDRIAERVLR